MRNMIYFLLILFISNAYGISLPANVAAKMRQSLVMSYNWPEPDENIKKFPHEKNCHYYYYAEGDDLFSIHKCPKGEIFDYHKHECAKKSDAQCFSDHYGKTKLHDHIHSKIRKVFKCPSPDGNFPDIFDCQKYFHCTNGMPKHRQCHSNKYFDKLKRHCVDQKEALCADITDISKDDKTDYKCPKPHGSFADPKSCSLFYKCLHRNPMLRVCEHGKLYDETLRRCVAKESVDCGSRFNPYEYHEVVISSTLSSTLSMTAEKSTVDEKTNPENMKSNTTIHEPINVANTTSNYIPSSTVTSNNPSASVSSNNLPTTVSINISSNTGFDSNSSTKISNNLSSTSISEKSPSTSPPSQPVEEMNKELTSESFENVTTSVSSSS